MSERELFNPPESRAMSREELEKRERIFDGLRNDIAYAEMQRKNNPDYSGPVDQQYLDILQQLVKSPQVAALETDSAQQELIEQYQATAPRWLPVVKETPKGRGVSDQELGQEYDLLYTKNEALVLPRQAINQAVAERKGQDKTDALNYYDFFKGLRASEGWVGSNVISDSKAREIADNLYQALIPEVIKIDQAAKE